MTRVKSRGFMNATMLPLMTIPLAGQTKDMYATESAASVLDVGGRRGGMMAPYVEIDVVDQDPIPLIRAVAVKVADSNGEILWELPSFAALRSLSDLLRPLPWFYRICNKLL